LRLLPLLLQAAAKFGKVLEAMPEDPGTMQNYTQVASSSHHSTSQHTIASHSKSHHITSHHHHHHGAQVLVAIKVDKAKKANQMRVAGQYAEAAEMYV